MKQDIKVKYVNALAKKMVEQLRLNESKRFKKSKALLESQSSLNKLTKMYNWLINGNSSAHLNENFILDCISSMKSIDVKEIQREAKEHKLDISKVKITENVDFSIGYLLSNKKQDNVLYFYQALENIKEHIQKNITSQKNKAAFQELKNEVSKSAESLNEEDKKLMTKVLNTHRKNGHELYEEVKKEYLSLLESAIVDESDLNIKVQLYEAKDKISKSVADASNYLEKIKQLVEFKTAVLN